MTKRRGRRQRAIDTCKRKIRWLTEPIAGRVIAELERKHGAAGLTPYRCPVCSGWHVGRLAS